MTEASFITTCVFNAFFSLTAITFNIVTILALRKPLTIPRAVKTLLMSQAVSDLGVGLLVQPLYVAWLVMQIQENTQIRTFEIISNLYGNSKFVYVRLVLWRCCFSYRQIPGHSSPSEIPGTRDSQASFFNHWWCLLPNNSLVLFQDLLSRTVPQKSNTSLGRTVSTEQWGRYGKCC